MTNEWRTDLPPPETDVLAVFDTATEPEYHVLHQHNGRWRRHMDGEDWSAPDKWCFLPPG